MQVFNFIEFYKRSNSDEPEILEILKFIDFKSFNCWLAGGALRRTILNQKLDSDYDFFFKDEDSKNKFVEYLKTNGFNEKYKNEKNSTYVKDNLIFQVIHIRYYNSASEILDSFDFTMCQFAFDGENIICGDYALWDTARKKLVINKLTYGTSTLRRIIKYSRQGFNACSGMLADLLEKTIENPETINREIPYID